MRVKLTKILGRILPERKHSRGKQFLRWPAIGLLGLLAGGFLGLNYLAEQQEQEIQQDLAEWAQQFPKTEANDSALKLRALVAKLGIGRIAATPEFAIDAYTKSHPDFRSSETWDKTGADIQEVGEYLDEQLAKPNDEIDAPPEKLRQYLKSKAAAIEAIKKHVRDNEVPRWETDITYILEGDWNWVGPSYINLVHLQRILALDILEKQRQGQTQGALEMLEVSWKINQSLRSRPEEIAQLVAIIAGRYPTGVMRKLDNLPVAWQQRLREHDYRKSWLTSVEADIFTFFNYYRHVGYRKDDFAPHPTDNLLRFWKSLGPVGKLVFRFSAIDYLNLWRGIIAKTAQQKGCSSAGGKNDDAESAWWNILYVHRYFLPGVRTPVQYMLELELNQKILQVKELATKTGQWPASVPQMSSLICPELKWVYQVSPDGTMSISLSHQPEWLVERVENQSGLPLTYSDRTPPRKKPDRSDREARSPN